MRAVTGGNMFMYRSTGTFTTPVWNLVSAVEDVSISDMTRGLAEIKLRSSQFAKNLATLIETISVSFKHWYGIDSATVTALQTLFFTGIVEEWAIMDAPIALTGAQGLRCPMILSEFPIDQGIENAASIDCVLKTAYWESPAGTQVDPSWYTVVGGTTSTTTTLP